MALLPSAKLLGLCLLSASLLTSCQQPTATQHFKSDAESTMSVTTQMANSSIAAIHHEALCRHIAAHKPFCFRTLLVFLSSWLQSHTEFHGRFIHQEICFLSVVLSVGVR
jgi:hypothetical protein